MQKKSPDVAVIIPALDEQENIQFLLPSLGNVISELGLVADTIVVDGGSRDGTKPTAEHLGARVIEQQEKGYGGALMAGFAASQAPYVVTMDADLSHHPLFLRDFWRQKSDAELLIASRYVTGGMAEMPAFRHVLSVILNRVYARVLAIPVSDLSSGFRMYHRNTIVGLDLQARDFDVLEEVVVKIYLKGGRIKEVPFHYQARRSGKSHAKLVRFGWAFLRTLYRMWRLRNSVKAPKKKVRKTLIFFAVLLNLFISH